jgi:hypothetical protein
VNDAVLGNTRDFLALSSSTLPADVRRLRTDSWADNGRDILNFIISYLPPYAYSPSHELPRLPSNPSLLTLDASPPSPGHSSPSSRSHRDRLVVGIGHSAGGTALAFASTAAPSVFSSVILCDPVLPKEDEETSWAMLARGAIARRERWGSRDEAKAAFLSKSFFRQWDERVLDAYLDTGLREVEGGVALKTKPLNEAVSSELETPSPPFANPFRYTAPFQ